MRQVDVQRQVAGTGQATAIIIRRLSVPTWLSFASLCVIGTLVWGIGWGGSKAEAQKHRTPPSTPAVLPPSPPPEQKKLTPQAKPRTVHVGEASWYGPGFHGRETSNGEVYNQNKLTAAHPTLPEGTKVKVTNLDNGKSVNVRINDRGPYVDARIIDLSKKAAKILGIVEDGTAQVKVEVLSRPE